MVNGLEDLSIMVVLVRFIYLTVYRYPCPLFLFNLFPYLSRNLHLRRNSSQCDLTSSVPPLRIRPPSYKILFPCHSRLRDSVPYDPAAFFSSPTTSTSPPSVLHSTSSNSVSTRSILPLQENISEVELRSAYPRVHPRLVFSLSRLNPKSTDDTTPICLSTVRTSVSQVHPLGPFFITNELGSSVITSTLLL